MEQLRIEIWDLIFKSGPLTRERIAESLKIDLETAATVVEHEWFEIQGTNVQIATGKPPSPAPGLIG